MSRPTSRPPARPPARLPAQPATPPATRPTTPPATRPTTPRAAKPAAQPTPRTARLTSPRPARPTPPPLSRTNSRPAARPRRLGAVAAGLAVLFGGVLATGLGACSSGPPADARKLLADARATLDRARTLHFAVDSSGLPNDGLVMVGADGSAKRPASFTGSFRVATSGVAATIQVVSVDGTLYAKLPFRSSYEKTDPEQYGVADPADLLRPGTGLASLLTSATHPKSTAQTRQGREILDQVTAKLPASVVARFLFVADRKATMNVTFSVVDDSHELRNVKISGPFYDKKVTTTYTVTLDRYGKPVHIEKPT